MIVKLLLFLILLLLSFVRYIDSKITNVTFHKQCYRYSSSYLPNVLELDPPKGKSIFFIESSCGQDADGYILFKPRQACSVESAARAHPDRKIYVLMTSLGRINFGNMTYQTSVFSALKVYKNIEFAHINYMQYFKNSPVTYEQASKLSSNEVVSTYKTIEPLRLLTLWRYGGVYLDLDIIVLKPLKDLAVNFFGALDKSSVGDAVMGFNYKDKGHSYLQKCLTRLGATGAFNETGKMEFYTIMKCYASMCHLKDWLDANMSKYCQHLVLYPPDFFYPVHYLEWTHYFDTTQVLEVFERVQRSYAVHFWNKFSGHLPFIVNSSSPYAIFARKYCPEVIKITKQYM